MIGASAIGARNRTEAAFIAARLVGSTVRAEGRFKHEKFVIKGLSAPAKGSNGSFHGPLRYGAR